MEWNLKMGENWQTLLKKSVIFLWASWAHLDGLVPLIMEPNKLHVTLVGSALRLHEAKDRQVKLQGSPTEWHMVIQNP